MPDTRRYLFHGHAAALNGRIVRIGEGKQARFIKDAFIDTPAAALPAAGGRSTARISGDQLAHPVVRSLVRFESATAVSQGVFDDANAHFAVTLGKRVSSTLTTTTTVSAEVRGLDVGLEGKVRMVIKSVRGGFTSQNGNVAGETPVQLNKETGFDGNIVTFVDENGKSYTLTVDIERDLFREHDTLSAITAAASEAKFLRKFGHVLHMSRLSDGKDVPIAPALVRTDDGAVQGTIVKPLTWKGPEFPGSKIDRERPNTVSVPGLGRVFLGEITLARQSRRVTMVRLSLGSPAGGDFAAVDVMDNGSFSL
jgi:hypothetical protein